MPEGKKQREKKKETQAKKIIEGKGLHEGWDVERCDVCGLPLCAHKFCINNECSRFYACRCYIIFKGRGDT